VNPASFTFLESAMVLAIVVLGGPGSVGGVVAAALVLVLLPEYLRPFAQYRMLVFGAALVAMMIFRARRPRRAAASEAGAVMSATLSATLPLPVRSSRPRPVRGFRRPARPRRRRPAGDRGEIAALIGPNGAGKTTLFNCLTGLCAPSAGELHLLPPDGGRRNLGGLSPNRITAFGVARTFQNIRLFPAMSALENVMVGRHARTRAGVLGAVLRGGGRAPRSGDRLGRPGPAGERSGSGPSRASRLEPPLRPAAVPRDRARPRHPAAAAAAR